MDFIYFLIIGAVAGWLAGQITKGRGFGILGNIVVGILGSIAGGFLVGLLGFYATGGLLPRLVTATLGAVILLFLLQKLARKR